MKKVVTLLVCFCICFSFTACGMSEEAKAVDELILRIGEVTLESGDIINEAQERYNALPEKQQDKLKNDATLRNAIRKYDQLVAEEQVRLEEIRQQTILDNYCKVLRWIADNGKPTYSDDVNDYGAVKSYSYEGYSFDTKNGAIDASCRLRIKEIESCGREDIGSVIVNKYIDHFLYIDVKNNSLKYAWDAYVIVWMYPNVQTKDQAYGEIKEPISEFSTQKTDYLILSYEELDAFRENYEISDVRTQINEDMQKNVKMFADFIKEKVGLTLKDIGFEHCS